MVSEIPDDDPAFLSIGQVAKRLGYPVTTIRDWEGRGILVSHHRTFTGNARRYRIEDVEELEAKVRGDRIAFSNWRRERNRKAGT